MQELWRQGRGNRDKFSHKVELSPAKVNEKRRFFFAGSNLFSKRSQQKNQENPEKKQNKSLFWSAFGSMAFGAFLQKSDLVADGWLTFRRYLFFWVSALARRYLCWGISLGKVQKRRTVHLCGREKKSTNKSERSTEATKPKSCRFFFLAYTTSWDKWFVFWISSRSSSFTFELRLSPL